MAAADLDAVLRYLFGAPGRAAAERALWRQRLPEHLLDDVRSRAAQRALRAVEAAGTIHNVGGFAHRLLQRGAQDVLRARRADEANLRRLGTVVPVDDLGGADVAEPERPTTDDGRLGAAAREAVVLHAARSVPVAAAALAFLSIRDDGAVVAVDCPQPAGGVGPVEAATWAGLWYAGERACFPSDGQVDGPAIRKRRERAGRRVRELLADVAEAVL